MAEEGPRAADAAPRYPVHVRKVPRTWWLRSGPFRRFAARELTSGFAAAFSLILLLFLFALSRGRDEYEGFLRWLDTPVAVSLMVLILVALVYHTLTWFRLTTRILVIRVGQWVVPPRMVMGLLIVAWVAASSLMAYIVVWL
jgi:fumarate reductase subunit C